jgi:coproporphyrinogen III oxidase
MQSYKERFEGYLSQLQNKICESLEMVDGNAKFKEDLWEREGGGGGRTRVISNGSVFEKGGVNISSVEGNLPESIMNYLQTSHSRFFACGLSLVIHPLNPYVPCVHSNYRYFELYTADGQLADQWFGGGSDLTPFYLFDEDITHFHGVQKDVCDRFENGLYPRFKEACDNYFFNSHRNEYRGVGGLFYDYLRSDLIGDAAFWYEFVTALGDSFLHSYLPIVNRRRYHIYGENERYWQEIRRGRYVEFNLIHDKGTLFGLKTKGRTESILMSLPPRVRWDYNFEPPAGSEEERLLNRLQKDAPNLI